MPARIIGISLEVVVLTAILGCLLAAVWLAAFDLGLAARYKRAVTMAMVMAGVISVIFFIAHLVNFYPG